MAGTRKRKHAAETDDTTQKQMGIKTFGAMSKAKDSDAGSKKQKTIHTRKTTPPPQVRNLAQVDKKRKRGATPEDEDAPSAADDVFKRYAKKPDMVTPSKRVKNAPLPTPAETPSKDTAALFDKLRLANDAQAIPFPLDNARLPATPPHTPEAEESHSELLPTELQELVGLHAAFLSGLSIYYSHNGTSSPASIHALLPMITKNWKKRAVTLDDLRRLLGVNIEQPTFRLKDCGRAGVCLTKHQPRGRAMKRAAGFIDEVELNAAFGDALTAAWVKGPRTFGGVAQDVSNFIEQLPLIDIAEDASVAKTAPLFARGQQRLAELKAGQAAAAKREPTPVPEAQPKPKCLQTRGTNLLDRVLAKQANAASLPAGPSREQLERKSALHRVEDVARILGMLAAGKARCSFSMQAMVQQLQQSLRSPISREEIERCLELMAQEITPGFVGLVKNGAVSGVVVSRASKVESEELRARVARAVA